MNRREGQIIRKNHEICCNRCVAGRSRKEHYQDNKKKIKVQRAEYRQKNKDKIKVEKAEYYQKNKGKIAAKTPCPHCAKVMRKDSIQRHIGKYCKSVPK